MPQRISNKEVPRANFTQTPNIIYDLELSVYARDLYQYYRRVGDCIQCTNTIAEKLRISPRQVAYAKKELLKKFPLLNGKSLISDTPRFYKGFQTSSHVEIEDIWLENDEYFKECLRSAQNARRNDYLKDDLPRENASTDNISGLHHMQAGPAPYADKEDYINKKASKLASHPSDLPSGNHQPEEEDDEDYGFPDPGPEEIPISREDADHTYHKLRDTYKLCHEDAKFLAIRYRGPEIKAQLNNMERQIAQGIKITKPGKWIRGVLEQECGKRSPCSQLKRGKL